MHDRYDEEIDGGLDNPIIVVVSSIIKKLNITTEGKYNKIIFMSFHFLLYVSITIISLISHWAMFWLNLKFL